MNEAKTKKVYIDLWGKETTLQRKRLIAEVPANCEDKHIQALDSDEFENVACESVFDANWETEEADGVEVLSDISVEPCNPDDQGVDVRLVQDEYGQLVIASEEG